MDEQRQQSETPRGETPQSETRRAELPIDRATSLTLVARLAEDWNGRWIPESRRAGRLGLPVLAGVRHGWVEGRLTIESGEGDPDGSILLYHVDKSEYRVRKRVVALLLFSAWAALVVLFFPFFPRLAALLPVCLMILVGAWLFIVGALRNSGPEEFFEMLEEDAAHSVEEEADAAS